MRGGLGAIILADAGRVYFEGESPRGWHTVVGGGFYFPFSVLGQPFSSSALHARGETSRIRLQLDVPF